MSNNVALVDVQTVVDEIQNCVSKNVSKLKIKYLNLINQKGQQPAMKKSTKNHSSNWKSSKAKSIKSITTDYIISNSVINFHALRTLKKL